MPALIDLTGQQFGRWTALTKVEHPGQHAFWKCRCECGTVSAVRATILRNGRSLSCGCLQREITSARKTTHGGSGSAPNPDPLYLTWQTIKKRCFNPRHLAYHRYGGRGITMHPAWRDSFEAFRTDLLAAIGPRPAGATSRGRPIYTLDRKDNDGNYEPGNLRWATNTQQMQNSSINKVDAETVAELRRRFLPGRRGNRKALADEFGILPSLVTTVVTGKTWRNVDPTN